MPEAARFPAAAAGSLSRRPEPELTAGRGWRVSRQRYKLRVILPAVPRRRAPPAAEQGTGSWGVP